MTTTTNVKSRIVGAMRGRHLWHEAKPVLRNSPAPILIYHAVAREESSNPYILSEHRFRLHLQTIVRIGVPVVHLLDARDDAIALTFDDGCTSWLDTIAPMLVEYDLRATFFVIADRSTDRGSIASNDPLTWQHIRELANIRCRDNQPLFEIGSHGLCHENLAQRLQTIGPAALEAELTQSRDMIEQHTGHPCRLLSIPGGKTGDDETTRAKLRAIARDAGFLRVRDSLPRYDRNPENDFLGGSPIYSHTSPAMLQFEITRTRRGNLRNTAQWLLMRGMGRWIELSTPPSPTRTPTLTHTRKSLQLTWHLPRLATQGCGMSRRVRDLAAGLNARGHDQQIIIPNDATAAPPLHIDSIPVRRYDLRAARQLHWSLQARTRARNATEFVAALAQPGDAILTTQPEFAAAARERFPDLPIILVACCSQLLYEADDCAAAATASLPHRFARALNRRLLRANERRGCRAASVIAFDSQMTRDLVRDTYALPPQRCHVLSPCVDTHHMRPPMPQQRSRLRQKMNLPPDGFVVCWTGRMEDRKNVELLIDAAALAANAIAAVLLVGDGADRATLEARSAALGLTDKVRFVGSQPDVLPYLQAADTFVLPSLVESFGIALLEAMSVGLPCIALSNDIPAVNSNAADLLGPDRGILLKTTDPAELAHRLRDLATSSESVCKQPIQFPSRDREGAVQCVSESYEPLPHGRGSEKQPTYHTPSETRATIGANARAFVQANYATGRDADQLEQLLDALIH